MLALSLSLCTLPLLQDESTFLSERLAEAWSNPERTERFYDARDLAQLPLQQVGIELQATAEASTDADDEPRAPLEFLCGLVERVARTVDVAAKARVEGLGLLVTAEPRAHERANRCLSGLRMRLATRQIVVEGHSFEVDAARPGALQEALGKEDVDLGASSATLIGADDRARVLKSMLRLATQSKSSVHDLPRLRVAPMQPWRISDLEQLHYVEGYERVRLLDDREIVVPTIASLPRGLQFRGRAVALPEGEAEALGVDLELIVREVPLPAESFETSDGRIDLPEGHQARVSTVLTMEDGGLVVFALPGSGSDRSGMLHRVVVLSFRAERVQVAPDLVAEAAIGPRGEASSRTDASGRLQGGAELTPPRQIPEIHGVVADANSGMVLLSVGANDGVRVGFPFDVYRGGTYLGRVEVTRVEPDTCSAKVILQASGEQIQAADKATTRL